MIENTYELKMTFENIYLKIFNESAVGISKQIFEEPLWRLKIMYDYLRLVLPVHKFTLKIVMYYLTVILVSTEYVTYMYAYTRMY